MRPILVGENTLARLVFVDEDVVGPTFQRSITVKGVRELLEPRRYLPFYLPTVGVRSRLLTDSLQSAVAQLNPLSSVHQLKNMCLVTLSQVVRDVKHPRHAAAAEIFQTRSVVSQTPTTASSTPQQTETVRRPGRRLGFFVNIIWLAAHFARNLRAL